jgi:hypothetical protein
MEEVVLLGVGRAVVASLEVLVVNLSEVETLVVVLVVVIVVVATLVVVLVVVVIESPLWTTTQCRSKVAKEHHLDPRFGNC